MAGQPRGKVTVEVEEWPWFPLPSYLSARGIQKPVSLLTRVGQWGHTRQDIRKSGVGEIRDFGEIRKGSRLDGRGRAPPST